VTPDQLLPYLPLSLRLIRQCLDEMADGTSVLRDEFEGIEGYYFTAYEGQAEPAPEHFHTCLSCGRDLDGQTTGILCSECEGPFEREISRLAETWAWPAEAVAEHEILYLAADHEGPVRAEDLASRSPYTLGQMRRKLKRLTLEHYLTQDLDSDSGTIIYRFPDVDYPRERFRRNLDRVRQYPASLEEEMETKVVRAFLMVGLLVLVMFVLALMHVPYPILVIGFIIAAPLMTLAILRHRDLGPIDSRVLFDSTAQTLEMTRDPERGTLTGRDDVQVQSADGYTVSVDVTAKYRIKPGVAHKLYQDTGSRDKYKVIVRNEAQKACMSLLGQMGTEDFYDPEERRSRADEVKQVLSEALDNNYVQIIDVLMRDVQFDPEYERKIQRKKPADQEVEYNKSKAVAEEMHGRTICPKVW